MSNNRELDRLEARARRAARAVGLIACKSRQRAHVPNLDNFGEFMLVDAEGNYVVAGGRYDMSAEQVLDYCGVAVVRSA
jgi:hypothetical protein